MFPTLSSALLFVLASASTLARAATNCAPEHGGIKSPTPNSTLVLGQPFNLTFCSNAYFKIHTIDIDIVAYPCFDTPCSYFTSGEEAIHALKPVDEYGYQTNVTLYSIEGDARTGQWAIGVLDHTSGYYTAGDIGSYFVPVTFVEGPNARHRRTHQY
ncbi:hypothetical protein K432DRAFT_148430 [Lepidopterella palustris CBS 459.81]|uniref:Uncharacterized protein n=1 Tax=Lepidopterella palustris CBS 459.81 TaxID=1314670 RepID=A0A8E2JBE4_9PEZI|nr:hypothetical protein K432DRAFT_148430 [Lepidopterella palustris CBS 459.81]